MPLGRLVLLPIAMTGLALWGVQSAFGSTGHLAALLALWALCAAATMAVGSRLAAPRGTRWNAATRTVHLPGSWATMGLILAVFLMKYGIINQPLDLFYNAFSLNLVMVYAYLPFMILPLYTQLVKLDGRLHEAASDLGAGPIKAFLTITLPLSKTGIIAGSMLVFVPAVGEFVIPELVGGPENLMIGKVLWQAFFDQNNWPLASAVAVIMVALLVIPIALFHRYENREITEGSR